MTRFSAPTRYNGHSPTDHTHRHRPAGHAHLAGASIRPARRPAQGLIIRPATPPKGPRPVQQPLQRSAATSTLTWLAIRINLPLIIHGDPLTDPGRSPCRSV